MDNQQNPFGGTLQFKIWVTRGCYFTLADRLNRKARYSVISITILSFYVFVISLVTLVFGSILRATDAQILSTASIILSVFIIIMTLFEYSKNYVADAERSQNTAHALEQLYNRYEGFLDAPKQEQSEEEFRKEYNEILKTARTGRSALDYHWFRLANFEAFGLSWLASVPTVILVLIEAVVEYGLYIGFVAGPIIVLVISGIWRALFAAH